MSQIGILKPTDKQLEEQTLLLRQWNEKENPRIYSNSKKLIAGVRLDYDTCLGINEIDKKKEKDKEIHNKMMVFGDNVVFTAGVTVVIKNHTLPDNKKQLVLSQDKKLRNVTALDAKRIDKGRKKMLITAAESSFDEISSSNISIHVIICEFDDEIIWRTISCRNISGNVKRVQSVLDKNKRLTLALVSRHNDRDLSVYLWNFEKDRLLAKINLKFKITEVSIHPKNQKHFLFFSPSHLRIWEHQQQNKTFEESFGLVTQRVENEGKFVQFSWMTNKYCSFLLVLCRTNEILFFQNEMEAAKIRLDLNSIPLVKIKPKSRLANEVDETFGFGHVLDAKIKEKVGADDIDDKDIYEEIKQHEDKLNNEINQNACVVNKFCCSKNGFVVSATGGIIAYFLIDKFDKIRDQVKKVSLSNPQNYQVETWGPEEEVIYLSVSKNFSLTTLIVRNKIETTHYLLNDLELKEDSHKIEDFFVAGYHRSNIHDVTLATSRSIFATAGRDDTVRLWMYENTSKTDREKKGIMFAKNQENPVSVSLHPFGFFLAVAFSNGFKVYTLIKENFFLLKEKNLINCNHVLFSEGGQYLLSNEKSVIYVYDSIFFNEIYKFEHHDSRIHNMKIVKNRYVISNCTKGRVFFWEIIDKDKSTGKHEIPIAEQDDLYTQTFGHEHTKPYTSFDYDEENDLFIASLPEKNLVVYRKKCKQLFFEYITGECEYTELLLNKQHEVLFCGTSRGSIRIHLWPPVFGEAGVNHFRQTQQILYLESYEFHAHLFPIDHLRLTPNGNSLISISGDGMVFILKVETLKEEIEEEEIEDMVEQRVIINEEKGISNTINDLFYVKHAALKNQQRIIKTMQLEVARYKKKMKTDEENRHKERRMKINTIEKSFKQAMKDSQDLRDTFFKTSDEKLRKRNEEIQRLLNETQIEEQRLTAHTDKMVAYEQKRNQKLNDEYEKLQLEKEQKIKEIIEEQRTITKELDDEYKSKITELRNKYTQIVENSKIYGENFLNKIELEEAEHEKEISMKSRKYEKWIKQESGENQRLQKKGDKLALLNTQSNTIDNKKQAAFEQLVIENTELLEEKVKICISLLKKQEQLLEREQVVFSKDETIKQAKDEQVNLENFRFMLDQKIKSLTANKKTLVEEIEAREKILRDMFNELVRQSQLNSKTYLKIKEKLKRLDILQAQKKNTELRIYYWNTKMKEYHRHLTSMLSAGNSKISIASKVKEMLKESQKSDIDKELRQLSKKDIVNRITKMGGDVGTNVHEELLNQNKWLLKKLHMINIASKQIRMIRDENIEMSLNQNKKLIEECNKLKIDNEFLVQQYNNYKKIINEARTNNRIFMKQQSKIQNSRISHHKKPQKTIFQEIIDKHAADMNGSGVVMVREDADESSHGNGRRENMSSSSSVRMRKSGNKFLRRSGGKLNRGLSGKSSKKGGKISLPKISKVKWGSGFVAREKN